MHLDLSLSVPGSVCLSFSILTRSFACGNLSSMLSHCQIEPALLPKRCMDSLLPTLGVSCFHVRFLLVLDYINFGSSTFLQSLGRSGLFLFAPEACATGVLLPSRKLCCMGDLVLVQGSFRGDSLTLLGMASSGLTLFARAFAWPDALSLAFSFASLASSFVLRQVQHLGFLILLVASQRAEPFLPPAMHGQLGVISLLKSLAHLEVFLLVFSLVALGFSLLSRSFARLGLALVLLGVAKVGSLPVLALAQLGFLLSPQQVSCSGFPISVPSVGTLGSSLLLQVSTWHGFTLPACGVVHMDVLILAPNHAQMGLLLLLKSLAQLEFTVPAVGFTGLGFLVSLRTLLGLGSPLFAFSVSRLGLFVSVSSFACLAASFLSRSFAQLGSDTLLQGMTQLGSPPFLRHSCRMELVLLVCLSATTGSSVFTVGHGMFGLPVLMKSLVKIGLALFVAFSGYFDPFLSLQQVLRAGPVTPVGPFLGRPGSTTLVIDLLRLGSIPFSKSFSRLDFLSLAPDLPILFGSTLLPHSFKHLASSFPTIGHKCSEALLSTMDISTPEPLTLVKSLLHFDTFLLIPDFSQPGLVVLVQRFAGPEPTYLILGPSCIDTLLSVLTYGIPGAFALMRSFGCLDLPFLTSDMSQPDSLMLVRNSICLDSGLFSCGECQFFQVSVQEFLTLDLLLLLRALS